MMWRLRRRRGDWDIVELSERQKLDGMHSMERFMKRLNFHWEVVSSKSEYEYKLESQGKIARRVGEFVRRGSLSSPMTESNGLSV
jgi:hypothetical protein